MLAIRSLYGIVKPCDEIIRTKFSLFREKTKPAYDAPVGICKARIRQGLTVHNVIIHLIVMRHITLEPFSSFAFKDVSKWYFLI